MYFFICILCVNTIASRINTHTPPLLASPLGGAIDVRQPLGILQRHHRRQPEPGQSECFLNVLNHNYVGPQLSVTTTTCDHKYLGPQIRVTTNVF